MSSRGGHQSGQPSAPAHSGPSGYVVYEKESNLNDGNRLPARGDGKSSTSIEELAANRAELYLLQRRILERVIKHDGWLPGKNLVEITTTPMQDVNLDADAPTSAIIQPPDNRLSSNSQNSLGIVNTVLSKAISSTEEARSLYEVRRLPSRRPCHD